MRWWTKKGACLYSAVASDGQPYQGRQVFGTARRRYVRDGRGGDRTATGDRRSLVTNCQGREWGWEGAVNFKCLKIKIGDLFLGVKSALRRVSLLDLLLAFLVSAITAVGTAVVVGILYEYTEGWSPGMIIVRLPRLVLIGTVSIYFCLMAVPTLKLVKIIMTASNIISLCMIEYLVFAHGLSPLDVILTVFINLGLLAENFLMLIPDPIFFPFLYLWLIADVSMTYFLISLPRIVLRLLSRESISVIGKMRNL
jgi:hypothetical protein